MKRLISCLVTKCAATRLGFLANVNVKLKFKECLAQDSPRRCVEAAVVAFALSGSVDQHFFVLPKMRTKYQIGERP